MKDIKPGISFLDINGCGADVSSFSLFDNTHQNSKATISLLAMPPLFDAHVHSRDPGFTYKEDLESFKNAALHGGFSGAAMMPNTSPVCDCESVLEDVMSRANLDGASGPFLFGSKTSFLQLCAVTKGQKGKEICDLEYLSSLGAGGFSDDGRPVEDDGIMKEAMKRAFALGKTISSHCEVLSLAAGGCMNQGEFSAKLGLKGIPNSSEYLMIERDIRLAAETDTRIHIAHVSTKEGFELIRKAKKSGIGVTCETCPHYFIFNDSLPEKMGSYAKMNPPLRSEADRIAVLEAVCDGTCDAIVTDHAPHSPEDKHRGEDLKTQLERSSFGVIGIETSFAASYTHLVKTGLISLGRLFELMCTGPRKLFGAKTDESRVALFDLESPFTVDRTTLHSKSENCVFDGCTLFGKCVGYGTVKRRDAQ